jgi:hypothetical protein
VARAHPACQLHGTDQVRLLVRGLSLDKCHPSPSHRKSLVSNLPASLTTTPYLDSSMGASTDVTNA